MTWLPNAIQRPITFRITEMMSGHVSGLTPAIAPPRVVLDTRPYLRLEEAHTEYAETRRAPHFTLVDDVVYQHLPLDQAAGIPGTGLLPAPGAWIVVLGNPDLGWLAGVIREIVDAVEATPLIRDRALTYGEWETFNAITLSHHVPGVKRHFRHTFDLQELAEAITAHEQPEPEPEPLPVEVVETEEEPQEEATPLGPFGGRPIKLGSQGKAVNTLRTAFDLEPGRFDEELEQIVQLYQGFADLEPDGLVDADTWAAIDRLLAEEGAAGPDTDEDAE